MVWWFVVAAVVLLVALALWRLDSRVKRREGYTTEPQLGDPYDTMGAAAGTEVRAVPSTQPKGLCEPMPKKLRCYLGFHRWHTVHVKDGNRYAQCSECGKVRLPEDPPPALAVP